MAKWMERHCPESGCSWWTRQDRVEWLDHFEAEHRKAMHQQIDRYSGATS